MCIGIIICRFLAENPPKTSNFGAFYNDFRPYYITPNSITHILAVCKEKGCRLCEFSARLTSGVGDCFAAASRANSEQLTVNSEKVKPSFIRTRVLVGESGFEPLKSETTDLQSAPVGRLGILPSIKLNISDNPLWIVRNGAGERT